MPTEPSEPVLIFDIFYKTSYKQKFYGLDIIKLFFF